MFELAVFGQTTSRNTFCWQRKYAFENVSFFSAFLSTEVPHTHTHTAERSRVRRGLVQYRLMGWCVRTISFWRPTAFRQNDFSRFRRARVVRENVHATDTRCADVTTVVEVVVGEGGWVARAKSDGRVPSEREEIRIFGYTARRTHVVRKRFRSAKNRTGREGTRVSVGRSSLPRPSRNRWGCEGRKHISFVLNAIVRFLRLPK